jgi:phosphatidylserine/phosphatidylglycerophosphate/cardiolipin synthase-like enzyme
VVHVKVILDRVNEQKRYTGATYLGNHGIAPLIDDRVAMAHNKVMVIDHRDVITGSFNFTNAAQERNAENVLLIIDDPPIAAA